VTTGTGAPVITVLIGVIGALVGTETGAPVITVTRT